jgi:hypothetical protein
MGIRAKVVLNNENHKVFIKKIIKMVFSQAVDIVEG